MKVQLALVLLTYKDGIYSEAVREFEAGFILTVLQEQKGNQVRDAQDLRIQRNTLRRMIHSLQISIQPIRAAARRRPPQRAPPAFLSGIVIETAIPPTSATFSYESRLRTAELARVTHPSAFANLVCRCKSYLRTVTKWSGRVSEPS